MMPLKRTVVDKMLLCDEYGAAHSAQALATEMY